MVFERTAKLDRFVLVANGLDASRLKSLFSRTVDHFHSEEEAISREQKNQLVDSLGLALEDVQLVLETILFIVQTAAQNKFSGKSLAKHLNQLGLEDEHVRLLAGVWQMKGSAIITSLMQSGFYSAQLDNITWSLDVEVANSAQGQTAIPNAKLQLNLTDGESITVGMNEEQLELFYTQLEQIQSQLDALA
eukprot:m.32557 g.32557  ORF g.32557 m.32557 type:complete len:191 (+) comp9793_c0_seq1:35-607(+)